MMFHHLEDQGGLQCGHEEHERRPLMTSSDLSRYPLARMQGLSAAIIQDLEDQGGQGGLQREHGEHERQAGMTSSDLSRYPLAMMQGGARPQLCGIVAPNDVPPSGRPRRSPV